MPVYLSTPIRLDSTSPTTIVEDLTQINENFTVLAELLDRNAFTLGGLSLQQVIDSARMHDNLDADMLDGHHASDFLLVTGGTINGSLSITGSVTDQFISDVSTTFKKQVNIQGAAILSSDLTVNGNLYVNGTMTTIHSSAISLTDLIITLNGDATSIIPSLQSGFEINRGTGNNLVKLLWDEATRRFVVYRSTTDSSAKYTLVDTNDYGHTSDSSGINADRLDNYHANTGTAASTIPVRDASGAVPGNITGNAATASKLQTARTITLSGDVTGSVSFDGSANVTITSTVVDNSHNHIISNVTGLQNALDSKVDVSSFSGSNILSLLSGVDGSGSGLDADTVDGLHASSFSLINHQHDASAIVSGTISLSRLPIGHNNGLDADMVDGYHASSFSLVTHTHSFSDIIGTIATSQLPDIVSAGTYTKVTVDTKGRVTSGTTLSESDIPNLNWSKIINTPTTLSGYGITDAQTTITGAASTITTSNLTADRALISNSSGKVSVSSVTSTELSYLSGVTSSIQTQLNNKLNITASMYIGTTSVPVNRASGNLFLTGVSIDGDANTVDGYHASISSSAFTIPVADVNGKIDSSWLNMGTGSTLNADMVDGYHATATATANTIPVSGSTGKLSNAWLNTGSGNGIDADTVDGYHAGNSSGQIPISNGTVNTNLNADKVDGYHVDPSTSIPTDDAVSRSISAFYTDGSSTNYLAKSIIYQLADKIGVGITNPSAKLHVGGNLKVDGPTEILNNLVVSAFTTLGGNLTTSGHATFLDDLEVRGNTTLGDSANPGNTTVNGALTATGNITGKQLISTVASGTAPLVVTSTTVVPNLNADRVDGYHASITPTGNTIPVSDSTGKIDNAWLNTGSGKGIDADTVDGYHATDFVLKTQQTVTTKESFTLTATDITNKYVTLSHTPQVVLLVYDIVIAEEGVDYYVAGNQIKWDGKQFETDAIVGDKINVIYTY